MPAYHLLIVEVAALNCDDAPSVRLINHPLQLSAMVTIGMLIRTSKRWFGGGGHAPWSSPHATALLRLTHESHSCPQGLHSLRGITQ